MAVRARGWHQCRDAVYQLQWREHQFAAVLGMSFAAAVDQIGAALLEPLHSEWGTRAVAQQSLQSGAVTCCYAHPGIDRKSAAMGVACHVFGVTCLNVTACHKGAQDAFAHVGLHLGDGRLIESSGWVKGHTFWQRLKHPIEHAHMEVHMRVQAGAKAVNECDRAQVQAGGISLCSAGAMGLQALLHHAQEDAQCRIERAFVTLQVVAQTLACPSAQIRKSASPSKWPAVSSENITMLR